MSSNGAGTRCPNCTASAAPLLRARDLNRSVSAREFAYFRCPACGMVFLSPHPPDLADFYRADYYSEQLGRDAVTEVSPAERFKVDLVRRAVPGGRLVEAGPGHGAFLHAAREAGFTVSGIEMDAGSVAFLREQLGIDAVQTTDVAGALAEHRDVDAIAMWHVVEHLQAPWDVLEAAATALRPGGALVLAAPNPEALQFRVLRSLWVHLDAPRHLQLIPAGVLRDRAEAAGFAVEHLSTDECLPLGWNTWGWGASLAHATGRPRVRSVLERAGAAAAPVLSLAERRPMRGSNYVAVLRRR